MNTESAPVRVAVYDSKPYDREYLGRSDHGGHVDWSFREFRLTAATAESARGFDAVCVFVNDRLDRECLDTLARSGVRHVALRCAGFNNVDLPAATALGISVSRVPAYSPHAVAEHAVALLLALNRRIHRAHNRVREHNFSLAGLVGFDIHDKTVGIVGTGKIGRITAEIFRGFGAEVLAFDREPDDAWAAAHRVRYAPWDDLLDNAEILSLHLPLTPETIHLFDAKVFQRLRRGVYLVNTSRGKLIDTSALIQALKTGHVGGVALDVYEEEEGVFFEDLSDQVLLDDELSRLLTFPNVLVTSHQAFLTHEALGEIARVTAENLVCLALARPMLDGSVLVAPA